MAQPWLRLNAQSLEKRMWKDCWPTGQKPMELCICLLIKCWYCSECVHPATAAVCSRQPYFCVPPSAVLLTTLPLLISPPVTTPAKLVAKDAGKDDLCKIHAFKRRFCTALPATRPLRILPPIMKGSYPARRPFMELSCHYRSYFVVLNWSRILIRFFR